MNIIPQTRRSTWSCNGVEVESTIVCVGRSFHRAPVRHNVGAEEASDTIQRADLAGDSSYQPIYTVEVEFGSKVLRVRSLPNAEALEWEQRLVYVAFVELGAIEAGG